MRLFEAMSLTLGTGDGLLVGSRVSILDTWQPSTLARVHPGNLDYLLAALFVGLMIESRKVSDRGSKSQDRGYPSQPISASSRVEKPRIRTRQDGRGTREWEGVERKRRSQIPLKLWVNCGEFVGIFSKTKTRSAGSRRETLETLQLPAED